MAQNVADQPKPYAGFPWWFAGFGLLTTGCTIALAVRLIWEMTALTWAEGPQMIGHSLIHGPYGYIIHVPPILLLWLVAALIVTIVALVRKKRIRARQWVSIGLAILALVLFTSPPSVWLRVFPARFAASPYGSEFLFMAAAEGDTGAVDELLSHGVAVNVRSAENGRGALYAAVINNQPDMVAFLITKGINLNVRDCRGDSPLDCALSMGYTEVAEVLVQHGARSGRTPFQSSGGAIPTLEDSTSQESN